MMKETTTGLNQTVLHLFNSLFILKLLVYCEKWKSELSSVSKLWKPDKYYFKSVHDGSELGTIVTPDFEICHNYVKNYINRIELSPGAQPRFY